MARTLRNGKLDTRTARAKLAERREPYWTVLVQGGALGYRRGRKAGTWIARWRDRAGKQHYQSLGAADDALDADGIAALSFAQAQERARIWIASVATDAAAPDAASYTVNDALDVYLGWLARHRRSAKDATWKADALIRPTFGPTPLSLLSASAIRQWHEELAEQPARVRSRRGLDANGHSLAQQFRAPPQTEDGRRARRASANRVLTILKAALNRAYHDGKVPTDDAWRRVKPFSNADAARLRYLSRDECTRLLNACEPSFRKLVRAALLTGCRYGELARLEARDLDPDAGMLHVRTSKSGRPAPRAARRRGAGVHALRRRRPRSRRPRVPAGVGPRMGCERATPPLARGRLGGPDGGGELPCPAPYLGVAPDHGWRAADGGGAGARACRHAHGRAALRPSLAGLRPRRRAADGAWHRSGEDDDKIAVLGQLRTA